MYKIVPPYQKLKKTLKRNIKGTAGTNLSPNKNPPMIKIIKKYWRVLEGSRSSDLYAAAPVIAYRRLPNMK